jgi:N6-adenosine-specific RNA methylase IME4
MSFNIRKLKIQITCKKRELRAARPNTWNRVRLELKSLETALEIAMQNRADQREKVARAPRAGWDVWGNQTDKFAEAAE